MRSLYPSPGVDVDPLDVYVGATRHKPSGRPWVSVGMVASLDGATSIAGVSGDLGGDADRDVFRAVRATADTILVGAATVRAENYGPIKLSERAVAARVAAGLAADPPRLAIVSGSLDLDTEGRVFSGTPPVVFTTESSAAKAGHRFDGRAEVVACGDTAVDLASMLSELEARGVATVVCEGGPNLVGQLVANDLVDEWCLNIAGTVAGGTSPRAVEGSPPVDRPVQLASILEADGLLATRWLRR